MSFSFSIHIYLPRALAAVQFLSTLLVKAHTARLAPGSIIPSCV